MAEVTDLIVKSYLDALSRNGTWAQAYRGNSSLYTALATAALVAAGSELFENASKTAKNHRDPWRKSEYLTLDVMLTHPEKWEPPLFIAETENDSHEERIQYNVWKLLSVRARHRVLVAYWDGRKKLKTFEDLCSSIASVQKECGGSLILIAADYQAMPADSDRPHDLHKSFFFARRDGETISCSA